MELTLSFVLGFNFPERAVQVHAISIPNVKRGKFLHPNFGPSVSLPVHVSLHSPERVVVRDKLEIRVLIGLFSRP